MTERQKQLLKNIVNQYIEKAQPVGSGLLCEKIKPGVSSATIRNEMIELIGQGYLFQPHLSAGRLPSLKGIEYYVTHLLETKDLSEYQKKTLAKIKKQEKQKRELMKLLAKKISDLTGQLSILAFTNNDFYYTGLTNLFNQPEFQEHSAVYSISQIVDHLDKIMANVFNLPKKQTHVLIGKKNPFGNYCSAILAYCPKYGLIGIIGPTRMQYNKNIAFIDYTRKLLN